MFYLLFIAALALFCLLLYFSFFAFIDGDFKSKVLAVISLIVSIVVISSYIAGKENNKGSCVKYETRMYYNPSFKTMMPARVCVQRGEWVE